MLTPTDAKHEATVRRALESALISGVARPDIHFGDALGVWLDSRGSWTVMARESRDRAWLIADTSLTTDDAIALIVSTARGTL